jgi:hypothetical protein
VLDGREGRPDNAPKLTPEYLAKWEVIRKSRMAGSSEFDPERQVSLCRHAQYDVDDLRHGSPSFSSP